MISIYIKSYNQEDVVVIKNTIIQANLTPNRDKVNAEQFYFINNKEAASKNYNDAILIFDAINQLQQNQSLETYYDTSDNLVINTTP